MNMQPKKTAYQVDKPSSLFGQFADEQVAEVARVLDLSLERALQQAMVNKPLQ
jgi:hypothetical protein